MDHEKFEYFVKRTEEDLKYIREKVDKLWDFRSLVIGGSVVVSFLTSALVTLIEFYLRQ